MQHPCQWKYLRSWMLSQSKSYYRLLFALRLNFYGFFFLWNDFIDRIIGMIWEQTMNNSCYSQLTIRLQFSFILINTYKGILSILKNVTMTHKWSFRFKVNWMFRKNNKNMSKYKFFHEYVFGNIKIKNAKLEKYVSKDTVTF